MKKLIPVLFFLFTANQLFAQSKKIYIWLETEPSTVFENNTDNWKSNVPYKHFVRLISEVMEIEDPGDDQLRQQFYEYLMKNYAGDLKKMKLHKDFARMSWGYYDENNGRAENDYRALFEPMEHSSWQYESIPVKNFKFDPKKKAGPLYKKAEQLVVMGIE